MNGEWVMIWQEMAVVSVVPLLDRWYVMELYKFAELHVARTLLDPQNPRNRSLTATLTAVV